MSNNVLSLPEDFHGVHIHFVGIKGTGMAALVEILFHKGAVITGSDVSERFYTDEVLEKLGLKAQPFGAENITDEVQYVLYSSVLGIITGWKPVSPAVYLSLMSIVLVRQGECGLCICSPSGRSGP